MIIYGIDPGPEKSALCELEWDGNDCSIIKSTYDRNEIVKKCLDSTSNTAVYIEYPYLRGCYPSNQVIETATEIGKFIQYWCKTYDESGIYRINVKDWKLWLCGKVNANDTAVRNVLWEMYGGKEGKKKAKGVKKNPGPLYGFNCSHMYDALAIALYGKHLIELENE